MSRKRQPCARVMFSRARPWNAARPMSVWFSTPTASPASITMLAVGVASRSLSWLNTRHMSFDVRSRTKVASRCK